VHIGEADVAAAVAVGEGVVVHAELVEDGGPEIIDGADIGDGVVAEVIGAPWTKPGFTPSPAIQRLKPEGW
jgi:hypothetical protein